MDFLQIELRIAWLENGWYLSLKWQRICFISECPSKSGFKRASESLREGSESQYPRTIL